MVELIWYHSKLEQLFKALELDIVVIILFLRIDISMLCVILWSNRNDCEKSYRQTQKSDYILLYHNVITEK